MLKTGVFSKTTSEGHQSLKFERLREHLPQNRRVSYLVDETHTI